MNRLRYLSLPVLAIIVATALPASAGDFSWTGFYLGGTIGGNFTTYDFPDSSDSITVNRPHMPPLVTELPIPGLHKTDGSLLGGGQAGYNFQLGMFVIGFEGDFNGTSSEVSKPFVIATGVLPPFNTLDGERKVESSWMASTRLRAGVALHAVLIYATGGAAFTDVSLHASDSYTGNLHISSSSDDTLTGWTAGAGVEWAVTKAVSIGLEYRHSDFGSNTYSFGSSQIAPHSLNTGVRTDQALLRVNLLFNGLMGH